MGRRATSLTQGETVRSLRSKLAELEAIDAELSKRMSVEDPRTYGLPDLLRAREPHETREQFAARQDRELRDFIQGNLTVLKDGERRPILITPKMLEFLAGMFYRRTPLGIVWKGRGAGGSFCTAILMFLCLVYHRMSFTNMAGAQEQAKIIYRYTKDFWDCFPDLKNGILDGEPLQTETRLKTGAMIKTITASEKQTRGKHNPGLIIDESCQEAENVDRLIMAAMQNAMSEPNHMVVMVSTFHHPVGLFQEVWDYAEEKGFTRYQWSVFDSMTKCEAGLDTATRDDPRALEFCKAECPLTWQKTVVDDFGNMIGEVEKGCAGVAREGEGFLPRKTVMAAQQMNRGTNVFEIEYACFAPGTPVLTENGFERIEEIAPGTRVLTHEGNWRPAWPMRRRYRGKMVRISGQGGPDILATPEHPVFHRHGKKTGWTEARHFLRRRYATYLPTRIEQTARVPVSVSSPVGGPGFRPPVDEDLPVGPRLFGFLGKVLGDGYVEERGGELAYVGFCGVDAGELLAEFRDDARELFGRSASERGDYESLSVFGHRGLAGWLAEECGRYSHEKGLPPRLFTAMTPEEDAAFLRGYCATDGCVNDTQVRFATTSLRLAGQVYTMLLRNGIAVSLQRGQRAQRKTFPNGAEYDCREGWVVAASGPARDALLRLLGEDVSVRESRPHIRPDGDWMKYPRRSAEEVDYDGEVFNLEVDDDHTYCLPAMAVHNCERPDWMSPVYHVEWIERSYCDPEWPPPGTRVVEKSVGIDWGLEGQTALIFSALLEVPTGAVAPEGGGLPSEPPFKRCVGILDSHFMTGQLVPEAIKVLWTWVEKYGQENFFVYPDISHPFNNLELEQAGFDTRPVPFNKWKDYGVGNVTKFFTSPERRLRIRKNQVGLIEQLKRYRFNRQGKPIKKDDHGPDGLLCAMLHYNFEDMFALDFEVDEAEAPEPLLDIPARRAPQFEGAAPPTTRVPDLPPQANRVEIAYPKKRTSDDGQVVAL